MLNLTFQRHILLEPLVGHLRRLLDGRPPDAAVVAALPPELRALLTELGGRLGDAQRAVGRTMTTIATVSGECREAGQSLATIGRGQQQQGQQALGTLREIETVRRSAAEHAEHLTAFVGAVSSSITDLGSAVGGIGQRMTEFQRAVDESASQVVELASALKEIDGRAGDQGARLPDIGAAAVELGAGTRAVMEQVKSAVQIADGMQETAKSRAGEMESLIHGHLQLLQETVGESLGAIRDLHAQSGSIGKIVTVIESITKQTNLLALNAAILAAQSGTEGKSFSVVADEIRGLAGRTSRSAKEIAGVVCSVQSGADKAAEMVQRFHTHFDEGVKHSSDAARMFTGLVQQAQQATDVMHNIGRAMEEQHRGVELLVRSIDQVMQMMQFIQRVAAQHHQVAERAITLAEQTRHAARRMQTVGDEQASASRQIVQSVQPMVEQSRTLSRALSDCRDFLTPLHSHVQQAADQAAQLVAFGGSLRQAGATLQAIAAQWGVVTATDKTERGRP
jgi:methyl-accepting chemotaxis protein